MRRNLRGKRKEKRKMELKRMKAIRGKLFKKGLEVIRLSSVK